MKIQPTKIRKLIICNFFLLLTLLGVGQPMDLWKNDTTDSKKNYPRYSFFEVMVNYGWHLPTKSEEFNETIELNPWTGGSLRVGWKANGRKEWHSWHNYPSYGIGWFNCNFIPKENIVGSPNAIYLWYNRPIWVWNKFQISADLGVGLSYHFNAYDPESNPNQQVIGSSENVFFDLAFEGMFYLSPRFDLAFGADFFHFSNGRTRTPQYGMNLVALNTKLRYNFRPRVKKSGVDKTLPIRPELIEHPPMVFSPRWEFYLYGNIGTATPRKYWDYRDVYYTMVSFGVDAARHYNMFGKLGLGLDVTYDESITEIMYDFDGTLPKGVPASEKYVFGLHLGHEYMVQRWTVVTQVGVNLNKREYKGNWYGRVGLRYDLMKRIFLRVALRIPDGFKADFIEWGGGIYLYKKKKAQ